MATKKKADLATKEGTAMRSRIQPRKSQKNPVAPRYPWHWIESDLQKGTNQ